MSMEEREFQKTRDLVHAKKLAATTFWTIERHAVIKEKITQIIMSLGMNDFLPFLPVDPVPRISEESGQESWIDQMMGF